MPGLLSGASVLNPMLSPECRGEVREKLQFGDSLLVLMKKAQLA
jgi:hypothetical protein